MSVSILAFWSIGVILISVSREEILVTTDIPVDKNVTEIWTLDETEDDLSNNTSLDVLYEQKRLRLASVSNTSLTVTWEIPEVSSEHGKQQYELRWWTEVEDTKRNISDERKYWRIEGLTPYTNYTVQIRQLTENRTTPWSHELKVQTLVGTPWSPSNLTITDTTNTSLSLSWDLPIFDRGPILFYEVQWITRRNLSTIHHFNWIPATNTTYTITHLMPFRSYIVRVRGLSNAGNGLWSSVNSTTGIKGAPGMISQILFDKVTSTTITFRFIGPGDNGGFPTTHYIMKCKNIEHPEYFYREAKWEKGTPYLLNFLKPRATYNFSFAAVNPVGEGPWKFVEFTMPEESIPDPPLILTKPETVTQHPNRFDLRWDVPEDNGSPIFEYEISYLKMEMLINAWITAGRESVLRLPGNHHSYQLTSLEPNSHYKIQIRAINELGKSLPESIFIKTAGRDSTCTDNYCNNGGLCKDNGNGKPECYCKSPFTGERCQNGNSCTDDYCSNGGVCKEDEYGYPECYCKGPFTGGKCRYFADINGASRQILLVSTVSASVVVISVIAVSLLCCHVRRKKEENSGNVKEKHAAL